MKRQIYTFLLYLLMPWALLHLLWRSRRQREYLSHWGERFGYYGGKPDRPVIWIHAVSVGETRAAEPLIAALRARYPDYLVLLTHMTPTGRQTGVELFGDSVTQSYLAYDLPSAVERFLSHWQPAFGLIIETELWPNLIAACAQRKIPVMLVNGRLSDKSARRYELLSALTRDALEEMSGIAAQSEADAARLSHLGAMDVAVLGNLKFDITPPAEQLALGHVFRQRIGTRPVLLCASTREGEEALILDAWSRARLPENILLVIVPRHPQRFGDVAGRVSAHRMKLQRRSDDLAVATDTQVWLGDSLGEMFAYYEACNVAFVGGSLVDLGGQNMIEPCAVGRPVLIGPSSFNFSSAADNAIAAGACRRVSDAAEMLSTAAALLGDEAARTKMENAALVFAERHRGATARTVTWVEGVLSRAAR